MGEGDNHLQGLPGVDMVECRDAGGSFALGIRAESLGWKSSL